MKKTLYIACLLACAVCAKAQESTTNDSTEIDRTVYVTRDFQPTVQSAGKISMKPDIYQSQITLQKPKYSDFSSPLALDYSMNKLDFSVLNFRQPQPMGGYLQAGVGHENSLLLFNYRISDAVMQKKKRTTNDLILDIHANHNAQWGYKALSESGIGMDLAKQFMQTELYFGVNGGHTFFSRYGHYYDPDQGALPEDRQRLSAIDSAFKQNIWTANAEIGVRSISSGEYQYQAQLGYEAFGVPNQAIEHQIHTIGGFEWNRNSHHVGAIFDMRNRLYSVYDSTLTPRANHRFHLEPYYAYEGNRWRIHAGVNLDFSAGRGRIVGISPNVWLEADIAKNWLFIYAEAKGDYAANGARGEFDENRYISSTCLFNDSLSGEYKPVDAEIGFNIRPYSSLLINIHAAYALELDKHVNVFQQIPGNSFGMFEHELMNAGCWRVGANLHFHYRDILNMHIGGNYFIHQRMSLPFEVLSDGAFGANSMFDTPSWRVDIRIDGKINEKWSLYSDNHLMGGIWACRQTYSSSSVSPDLRDYHAEKLRPMFDLNLGVKYRIDKWFAVYAQLNNYLAWTPKMHYYSFYGYEAMGANCILGLSYSF